MYPSKSPNPQPQHLFFPWLLFACADRFPLVSGFTSSFESNLDGWTTGSGSLLSFEREDGGTPSRVHGTGPSGAFNGNYYVYCEPDGGNYPYKTFDLKRTFTSSGFCGQIVFRYHMYGTHIGLVFLQSSTDGKSWNLLWSKSGNEGDSWKQATVDVLTYQTQLRFTCVASDHEG